jgi:class 3 adenylate cyclase
MTLRLNEYFTEMSGIALKHGGTIDEFAGDAMLCATIDALEERETTSGETPTQ